MRRREFITLLGGAAAALPIVARAQKQDKPRLVGVLSGFSEMEMHGSLAAFRSELNRLGWVEGTDLILDMVSTDDYGRMAAEAGRLVSRNPDVIVTMGTPGMIGVRRHTQSIPTYSRWWPTRSKPVSSEVWRAPAVTRLASQILSSQSAQNGWSCSRR